MECWKAISNFGDGNFFVSDIGNVKRKAYTHIDKRGHTIQYPEAIIKVHYRNVRGRGYGYVTLCYKGNTRHFAIHRLVAMAFVPNPNHKPEVNHKDGNKHNNCASNLEWVTRAENMIHACETNLLLPYAGADNNRSIQVEALHYKTNALLAVFESINIAAKFCGKDNGASHILAVCNGKREFAFGYKWRYHKAVTTNESICE